MTWFWPVKSADHDLPINEYAADGSVSFRASVTLTYTPTEWHAFRDGIHQHEFDLETFAAV